MFFYLIFIPFVKFPEKYQKVPDWIHLWNYSPATSACFYIFVRWRAEHLAAEHNSRTFYQNQWTRSSFEQNETRSVTVSPCQDKPKPDIALLFLIFLIFFQLQPSSVHPMKISILRGNLFFFQKWILHHVSVEEDTAKWGNAVCPWTL